MTDLIFLKALREKLKGGNIRSIHLNALPGRYAARLDIGNLNYIKPDLGQKFIDLLLSDHNFEFKISFDGIDLNTLNQEDQKKLGLLSKRLNSLFIENEDNFKEHGIKTFGFGYPLLIKPTKQDPNKVLKAPLLIWPLEIIKSTNKVNTWSILRNKVLNEKGKLIDEEVHSVGINEVLISHIKTDENISIPQINEELLEDAVIDKNELIEICFNLLKSFNAQIKDDLKESFRSKIGIPVINLPDSNGFESTTGNLPWIHFGGVFGLYRTQKESIITDIDRIISNYSNYKFENLKVERFPGTALSAIDTDPSQQEILTNIGIEPRTIIQGPPGTGKSQSLTALIINALSNNLKCLVVCEKKTALEVIKKNLQKESDSIGALSAVIEDLNKDRDSIVNSARDRMLSLTQNISFNQVTYDNLIETLENKIQTLNKQHSLLDKKLYKGKTWTELVGEYLNKQRKADYSILKTKLDYKKFQFHKNEREFERIRSKIIQAKNHYNEVRGLEHPLEILNDQLFKEDNYRGLQLKLEEDLKDLTNQVTITNNIFKSQLEEYNQWLNQHYNTYYTELITKISSYKSFVSENEEIFGNIFYKNDALTKAYINVMKVFSKRHKTLAKNRAQVITGIEEIKKTHCTQEYIKHKYLTEDNVPDLKVYIDNIISLNNSCETWYNEIELCIKEYYINLCSKNIHPSYINEKIKETELTYEILLNKVSPIFKNSVQNSPTHITKAENTEKLISDLNLITNNLNHDFREYFEWRRFFIGLEINEKEILTILSGLDRSDWVECFESWYYYWLLANFEISLKDILKSEELINEIIDLKAQLKKVQLRRIINNWSLNQFESVKKCHSHGINSISLYNKRGSKGERRNSLRKIIATDFKLFTDLFPVIMVSPTVCSSIIPLKEALFDIVLFDEASQLRLEDTFPSLLRGKIKIVSGDSQQMPPSNFFIGGNALLNPGEEELEDISSNTPEDIRISKNKITNSLELAESESLLVYAENSGYKQSYLKAHYRSLHPYLIDFSNHAFYGKRLIPMPAKQEYSPIQFIEVRGSYDDQVNGDEARQVVDILQNHIKSKKGIYPSIGIATFNIYQRNLIIEEITKARQQKPEFDKKISELGQSFFVKNLENIQGDERDIIIISTTFGRRPDGTFRQQFGPILQKNGYKLLNVIITRAKSKIFVCSSIPNDFIQQYSILLPQFGNTGRAIFYAYLAYCKAVSENNSEIRHSILKQLYENCGSKSYDIEDEMLGSESPFEEEVYYRLAEKIGQERIQQQYRIGGFRIDLIIKSKITNRPVIAVECDGAKYHSSNEAYSWDMFRQSRLENHGFTFYRIWSTNWWYSSEKEIKKLVNFIQDFDKNEKPLIEKPIVDEIFKPVEIIPVTKLEESRKKVLQTSSVTLKSIDGKTLKVKFTDHESKQIIKPDKNGAIIIYERSPLARSIMGRYEGDTCQVGMLELYYEIIKIE